MANGQVNLDEFTVTASPLEMFFDDTSLSMGTCFFWEAGGKRYLVTNWHNVSGKNPLTGKHLSPTAAEPNRVYFDLWRNQNLNDRGWGQIDLEDGQGPIWLEHPKHRKAVDVVCVELPPDIAPHVFPINTRPQSNFVTRVADDVFILGYPLGLGVERLALWKRATIASEIDIDVDGLPKFLVDTASAKGMSGSPVIRRASSGHTDDGNYSIGVGYASRFVGIYSGRLTTGSNLDAQLGIIWRATVIDEIIAGKCRGKR